MAMKPCAHCGEEVVTGALTCPHWSTALPAENPHRLTFLLLILGLLIPIYLYHWIRGDLDVEPETPPTQQASPEYDLIVGEWKMDHDENFSRVIIGTVENRSRKRYEQVIVTFNLYERHGVQVGNTSDSIRDLEPRST